MMIELWKPNHNIPNGLLDLYEWGWDENGLRIILTDGKYQYRTVFEGQVISFRSTLESINWKFRDVYGDWRTQLKLEYSYSFFKLHSSEYIEWLNQQNMGINRKIITELVHYVFVTEDEIIDVLNDKEPLFLIECF